MKRSAITFSLALLSVPTFADERPPEVNVVQPGVRFTKIAEHPDLATPTGIDVDDGGNIWLVSCHTHMPPDDYPGPKFDEILVFEKDGAGRRVFYAKTHHTMDLELGSDGWVYLAERDRILRIRDTDGDGVADLEEDLATLETEADYPHNGLSGLAWHPDGDLCFGLGENFAKSWTLTCVDDSAFTGVGEGGIFRMKPDGSALHRIARGLWNPFGLCVREDGEMFAAENDPGERPPCRLLHIVEGGDYGYQRLYGPEAHHPFVCWNGELRGTLPMIHPSGEGPCGVTPLGRGVLVPSWSDHRIDFFPLTRKGASYSADRIALVRGSRYFRPVCIAPAGPGKNGTLSWYLTDWVDGRYQVHGYGRLWKLEIDPKAAADWIGPLDLEAPNENSKLSATLQNGAGDFDLLDLANLATHEDPFIVRAAIQALAKRATDWKPDDLENWPSPDRAPMVLALSLSGAPAEPWVRAFLGDKDPDVQFETLRWIADARLEKFLPEVEAVLKRPRLDFRRFEAAVATRNILSGKPESGVRDLDLLLAKVKDEQSGPAIRAWALRLLPAQPRSAPKDGSAPVVSFPKGLDLPLLKRLLAADDETLSVEVIRTLSGNPTAGQKLLAEIAGDSEQPANLRAEAVAGLGSVAREHLPLLIELAGNNGQSIREEALRCLRSLEKTPEQLEKLKRIAGDHPDSADLALAAIDPATLASGHPPITDTEAWLKRLDAIPGPADPEAGRRIFHHARIALCSNCHRRNGRGNVVGPDLSAAGARDDRKWLLESILNPNAEIAPEYLPRTITLKNGATFTGIRLRSSTAEAMRDTHGQNRSFNRNDIESMEELQVSFMPTGLLHFMTGREIRDLMAFLETPEGAD